MSNFQRLPQNNSFEEPALGFKGIMNNVNPELLPDGFVVNAENLQMTVEGEVESVPNPTLIGTITSGNIIAFFAWQKDDGTITYLAQSGTDIYKWAAGAWTSIKTFTTSDRVAFASGMFNKVYIIHKVDGLFSYDGTTFASVASRVGTMISLWKNRFFVAGDPTYPQRISWCKLNDPTDWTTPDVTGVTDLRTAEDSRITGIIPVGDMLYITTESASFSFSGYSNTTFDSFPYGYSLDQPVNNALVNAEGGIYFIGKDGIFAVGKRNEPPKRISQPIDLLADYTSTIKSCAYWNGRVYFLIKDKIFILNLRNGYWEKRSYSNMSVIYSFDHLYLGTSTGSAYKLDVPTSGYLSWYLITKVFNEGITTLQKRYKTIYVFYKTTATANTVNVDLFEDYSTTAQRISSFDSSVTLADSYYWNATTGGSALIWGTLPSHWSQTYSGNIDVKRVYAFIGVARTIQLKFSGTGYVGLLGFTIVFKPRRRRGVRV